MSYHAVAESEEHPDGKKPTTTAYNTQRAADVAQAALEKPLRDWKKQMRAIDGEGMNRILEDAIDLLLTVADVNALAVETKDKYDRKKAKRLQKP